MTRDEAANALAGISSNALYPASPKPLLIRIAQACEAIGWNMPDDFDKLTKEKISHALRIIGAEAMRNAAQGVRDTQRAKKQRADRPDLITAIEINAFLKSLPRPKVGDF